MGNVGRSDQQRSLPWLLAGLAALGWISLVSVVQPAGVVEVLAMIAAALIIGVSVLALVVLRGSGSQVPVRARARRPGKRADL